MLIGGVVCVGIIAGWTAIHWLRNWSYSEMEKVYSLIVARGWFYDKKFVSRNIKIKEAFLQTMVRKCESLIYVAY